jgi:hypothetical protein
MSSTQLLRHLVAGKLEAREAHPDRKIHTEGSGTNGENDSHDNVLTACWQSLSEISRIRMDAGSLFSLSVFRLSEAEERGAGNRWASRFLRMIQQTAPAIHRDFESILTLSGSRMQAEGMHSAYDELSVADFSKLALSANTELLSVACLGDIGWSDLEDPRRLITPLFEAGMKNP